MRRCKICGHCGKEYSVSVRSCVECPEAYQELWPKKRAVLRCGAEGERKGHVTVEFSQRCEAAARQEAPGWCPQEPRDLSAVYICQDCEERAAAKLQRRAPRLIYGRDGKAVVKIEGTGNR